jgi:hypothetical protein
VLETSKPYDFRILKRASITATLQAYYQALQMKILHLIGLLISLIRQQGARLETAGTGGFSGLIAIIAILISDSSISAFKIVCL